MHMKRKQKVEATFFVMRMLIEIKTKSFPLSAFMNLKKKNYFYEYAHGDMRY